MRGRTLTARAIALFGAGSAAIHQLRYAIGYGDSASQALAAHPHGYLAGLYPGIATAVVIAIAAFLIRLSRSGTAREAGSRTKPPFITLWLACAFALASIFAVQETLEGAGALASGGWIGLVLAVPVGLLVALALRGADEADVRISRAQLIIRVVATARIGIAAVTPPVRLLDLRLGARAPPTASVV